LIVPVVITSQPPTTVSVVTPRTVKLETVSSTIGSKVVPLFTVIDGHQLSLRAGKCCITHAGESNDRTRCVRVRREVERAVVRQISTDTEIVVVAVPAGFD